MSHPFSKLFTDHPKEVGESYGQHLAASWGFGFKLMKLAGCALIHGLVPGLHRTTVSDAICSMAKDVGGRATEAREDRMRSAGVWDVGL